MAKEMARLGISEAFRWAWRHFQVFRGRKGSGRSTGVQAGRVAKVERAEPKRRRRLKPGRRWPRQDTVPFLSCPEAQKLRFQRPGTLRCAPCSFPPGLSKISSACSARQRQSSRRSWSTPGLPCGTQPPQRRQPRRFSPNGPQGATRRSFNRGLPIPCRHADLRGLGRPANRIVWASRRNGTPRRDRYCFTKTKVEVNSLPSPFVPLVLVVIVLPSFETTMRLVA